MLASDRPKFVFFDLMDTLIEFDSRGKGYLEAVAEAVESLALTTAGSFLDGYSKWKEAQDHRFPHHQEVQLTERVRMVLGELSDDHAAEILKAYTSYYVPRTRLCAGVPEMLEAWTGVRKGVVSNFWISGFPQYLCRHHGISGYFEFVMDSSQVGWRKPNAEIYRRAMNRAGMTESESGSTLFIGDNMELDVAGPRSLGMRSVHYQGDWTSFRPA